MSRWERTPSAAYDLTAPRSSRPIVVIGAGGIVRDAHLPAYAKAGFEVAGICDVVPDRARALAKSYGIPRVTTTVADAVAAAPADAVFDLALVADVVPQALDELPHGAPVLIQKPLGETLDEALSILALCRRRSLIAAVNTQLRFAPQVAAARSAISAGRIGDLIDVEVRISVRTPWEMFPFVFDRERLELTQHSIHYIDLIRSFLGNPSGVDAVTVGHPDKPRLASTRTAVLLRYGDRPLRVVVTTDHDHDYGEAHEESFVKWEGTEGAIWTQLGLLLDYPTGGPDRLELTTRDDSGWRSLPFEGSWFPDAFIGSMGALQRYLEGSVDHLPHSVDDVADTMAVIEAAYRSSSGAGTRPRYGERMEG